MSLGRLLFILFLTFTLQACVSPKMAQEMQQGRISFAAGNFKQAFHELLPIAVKGKPEAQYAVGYMYYNGYGVSRDCESGIFWMNQAAMQCYVPAKRALCLIQRGNLEAARVSCPTQTKENFYTKTTVVNAPLKDELPSESVHRIISPVPPTPSYPSLPPPPLTKIGKATFLKKASSEKAYQKDPLLQTLVSNSLDKTLGHSEIKKGSRSNYTVQLFGSYSSANAKFFQSKFPTQKGMHLWRTERDGEKWFVLTYGQYRTATEAKVALNNLPHAMRDLHPWVRAVDRLECVG